MVELTTCRSHSTSFDMAIADEVAGIPFSILTNSKKFLTLKIVKKNVRGKSLKSYQTRVKGNFKRQH